MKKYLMVLMGTVTLFSTACSAGSPDFSGIYKRQGASDFEVAHNMNTSVTIEKQKDNKQFLVTFNSGYGNAISIGQIEGDKLMVNDMAITKKNDTLKMSYVDNPDVQFTFKAEK